MPDYKSLMKFDSYGGGGSANSTNSSTPGNFIVFSSKGFTKKIIYFEIPYYLLLHNTST